MLLNLRQVTFGYVSPLAKPLDMELPAGQVVALVGENGSGKSTLLKTLGGMLLPLDGSLELEGRPLAKYGLRELSKKVALVRMGLVPPAEMTVREFVSLGRSPYAGILDGRSREDEGIIDSAMDDMDVTLFASRKVAELSDGERSRVYLARALAQQVRLLLLDEPDAFMDIPRRKNLFVTLQKLSREKDMTVVLSTHWVDYAEKYADSILAFTSKGGLEFAPASRARELGLLSWAEV
ncbi:ABC transporter ATP-binding protein [Fibrobacter sp.]|uniref:ABC transporter ATP-binding protein n=1 Tax=Fibrobacter sp. TaxID=35828 RepID=UPI00388EE41D